MTDISRRGILGAGGLVLAGTSTQPRSEARDTARETLQRAVDECLQLGLSPTEIGDLALNLAVTQADSPRVYFVECNDDRADYFADELTEKLGSVLPLGLDSVFYANSGSEAVEAAVRLARMATAKPNIIVFQGGFHGRTVAAASLTTAGTRFSAGFSPLMGGVHMAPFPYAYRYGWNDDAAIDFALKELDYLLASRVAPNDTAAFLIEPVLGDGGYLPTPPRFLAGLRAGRLRKHVAQPGVPPGRQASEHAHQAAGATRRAPHAGKVRRRAGCGRRSPCRRRRP